MVIVNKAYPGSRVLQKMCVDLTNTRIRVRISNRHPPPIDAKFPALVCVPSAVAKRLPLWLLATPLIVL